MTAMQQVLAALSAALEEQGVKTVTAWTRAKIPQLSGAAAVLGVQETESGAAALWNYLGEKWDAARGCMAERYGKRLRLTLCADIYAPKGQMEAIEDCCGALEEVLSSPLLGLHAERVHRGEVGYDSAGGYLKCRCTVSCTAYFTATRTDESAEVTNFTLKGVLQ